MDFQWRRVVAKYYKKRGLTKSEANFLAASFVLHYGDSFSDFMQIYDEPLKNYSWPSSEREVEGVYLGDLGFTRYGLFFGLLYNRDTAKKLNEANPKIGGVVESGDGSVEYLLEYLFDKYVDSEHNVWYYLWEKYAKSKQLKEAPSEKGKGKKPKKGKGKQPKDDKSSDEVKKEKVKKGKQSMVDMYEDIVDSDYNIDVIKRAVNDGYDIEEVQELLDCESEHSEQKKAFKKFKKNYKKK